jgi:hypothetical protein
MMWHSSLFSCEKSRSRVVVLLHLPTSYELPSLQNRFLQAQGKVNGGFSLVVNKINVLSEKLVIIVKVWQIVERKKMEPVY